MKKSYQVGIAILKNRDHAAIVAAAMKAICMLSLLVGLLVPLCVSVNAQQQFEDRLIRIVSVTFEGSDKDISANDRLRLAAQDALGGRYSLVNVRTAIQRLFDTNEITSAIVEASDAPNGSVDLRFTVRRRTRAQTVSLDLRGGEAPGISEKDILLKLDLLEPGNSATDAELGQNADQIQNYLRDHGYFRAEVSFDKKQLEQDSEVAVIFTVTPNEPARIDRFDIDIAGFDNAKLTDLVKLSPGERYSRETLGMDIERVRAALRKEDFLAPQLSEPHIVFDGEKNLISIDLLGNSGPKVSVTVESKEEKVGSSTKASLLPVIREGTVDYSAIVEGERRLETHFQEKGFFFANVRSVCSVDPPLKDEEGTEFRNDSEFLCSALSNADLTGRKVELKYVANLDRRLKLTDIRLRGTDLFTIDDIKAVLESQEANILGIIPLFGYGRGYTSGPLLDQDAATIASLLRELGYREATVRVNQGVSPDGENLIITFVVDQGSPSVITDVSVRGNRAFDVSTLMDQLPDMAGKNFSRARLRNGQRKLIEFYSKAGYFNANVSFAFDDLGVGPATGNHNFRVIYTIENEGKPTYVGRILITGNAQTKEAAILKALTLHQNELLRSTDIYASEQNLYASDVFSRVEIKTQPAGDRPDGSREVTVVVNVEEQAPRILSYGGGVSTDLGASGFVDIRHLNLLGNLWQGGARARLSQRQQLFQLDFINPRFLSDGKDRFAPLTLTASFQKDSTVTRFFRSAFDQGTFGIVQRLDENGNPVDVFGTAAGDPTLNRFTISAETNRTLSLRDRTIIFLRYRFEDVRLSNIDSLLIKDLLLPDSRIRTSGFGVTFVRDTRKNCQKKYSIFDFIARGDVEEPCKYNASDPTRGSYLTAEYNVSVPTLGANIGFNKLQVSFNTYYTFPSLKNTTFAGRAILGLANVFDSGSRSPVPGFPDFQGILPISERFFAGGSNTLRGFDFESAGPRVAIVPQGNFFNTNGDQVFLEPFTVPFGGNALAVVNLEARIPFTESVRAVPFYDGGNVFRKVGDLFNPPNVAPGDIVGQNLRALWTHTIGLGLRLKTPVGGEFGIDYGYLLNPPSFVIPQPSPPNAFYRLSQSQIHFRFSQAF